MLFSYLSRCSNHNHHFLQVEFISGEVLDGNFIFDLTARLPCIVEHLPTMGNPGLQQDELRGEPLQNHGHQAVWTRHSKHTDAAQSPCVDSL